MAELVDARDLGSRVHDVRVRVSPSAFKRLIEKIAIHTIDFNFGFYEAQFNLKFLRGLDVSDWGEKQFLALLLSLTFTLIKYKLSFLTTAVFQVNLS